MSNSVVQAVQMLSPGAMRERPVVLHVDDDAAALMMAEGALEDAGFDIVHAEDGHQAIEQFHAVAPDLIIMDAVMPVMDGFSAIREIRKLPAGEHIPILMITGLDDFDSITRAYDEGATDFLAKPVNFIVLPHRVQYMLRSTKTANELRISQTKLDYAQKLARLGNWELDLQTKELSWSQEFGRMFNLNNSHSNQYWSALLERIHEDDRQSVQILTEQSIDKGESFNVEFSVKLEDAAEMRRVRLEAEPFTIDRSKACTHMLGTVQDITDRVLAQEQMHNLAYYDVVTGLPNRAQLNERMSRMLRNAERNESKFAVLFLDLDHFKQVNDTYGHDIGDELLQEVSERLTNVVRDSDSIARPHQRGYDENRFTVARLGGDEFVVLLGDINRAEDAARVADRIAEFVGKPYHLANSKMNVTTTIGISVFPADGVDCETLLKNADIAMYHAKQSGRDGYQFYSSGIHERAMERFSLERDLRRAIESEALTLVYQPKISVSTGELDGIEALVRWNHPSRGSISPAEFIPLAEETGLILPLGRWVFREACQQIQAWINAGMIPTIMSVNCSAIQFSRGDVEADISDALQVSGLDPHYLEIEITESLLIDDLDGGINRLNQLKAIGIQVSVDDFGTGFTSLSNLAKLPADRLKIDQSFVAELDSNSSSKAIVSSIITLGHNLDMQVVAEGVESDSQFNILSEVGCDEVQGYFISYPLSAEEFQAWVSDKKNQLRLPKAVGM